MLNMIEKLINEHGSSTILKERILLISDKYDALDEKLKMSEQKVEFLDRENSFLKNKIESLESEINATLQNSSGTSKLDDVKNNILKMLFSASDGISKEDMANKLSLEIGVVNYHFDELNDMNFLDFPRLVMGSALTGSKGGQFQKISQEGRKYVVEVIGT
jgi:chaperonin cofactor prefoldin